MTELYKARYSQAIPGVNRIDDTINFTHGEKCISHFGDGLSQPQKVTADASLAQNQGRNKKLWLEHLNKNAENSIREAFKRRENKVRQWREHLNKEVDKLAKEIQNVVECRRELNKKIQYFSNLLRVSQVTSDFRRRIEDSNCNDHIGNLLKEEERTLQKAGDDTKQCFDELNECEKKLQKARNALMSEVEAKSLTINIGKRCQHAEPLLSFPYVPADHPVDQLYHPNTEEDWEKNLADKIENAVSLRKEATNCCSRTGAAIRQNESDTADAWFRTSKALQEAVQDDEKAVFNLKNLLQRIGEDMTSANQRVAYFYDDFRTQDRVRDNQMWRLQTMTYRPGQDHIRDVAIKRLEEEVGNIEKKNAYISDNMKYNKQLLHDLNEEKIKQTLELEKVSKRLFINRENCLGARRTVLIEGVNLNDYI